MTDSQDPGEAPRDDAVNDVIDRTALIENLLNQLIEAFLSPREGAKRFLWDIALHSSIMPLGSKSKIAMAIAQEVEFKLDQNSIHQVIALRNAFAHHGTNAHPAIYVSPTEEEDQLHYHLKVISNSGRVAHMRRFDALNDFNLAYAAARESLVELLKVVRGSP